MIKIKIKKKRLILMGILLLLTFAVTALVRVKADITYPLGNSRVNAGVYATLGDACIFFNVLVLGAPWGAAVSVLGMVIADIVVGSKLYIIGTLLIKTAMAFFIASFCLRCDDWVKCFAVAAMAEAMMVLGYFVYDLVIVREFAVAGKAFLVNLGQGAACTIAGGLILHFVPPVHPERLPQVKRRAKKEDNGVWN